MEDKFDCTFHFKTFNGNDNYTETCQTTLTFHLDSIEYEIGTLSNLRTSLYGFLTFIKKIPTDYLYFSDVEFAESESYFTVLNGELHLKCDKNSLLNENA